MKIIPAIKSIKPHFALLTAVLVNYEYYQPNIVRHRIRESHEVTCSYGTQRANTITFHAGDYTERVRSQLALFRADCKFYGGAIPTNSHTNNLEGEFYRAKCTFHPYLWWMDLWKQKPHCE